MENLNKEIGMRIWKIRDNMGYSQEKFSELIDITSRFLSDIETGKKGMSVNTLYTISKALNISCDYLLFGKASSGQSSYISGVLSTLDEKSISHLEKIIMNIMQLKEIEKND